jgi:hypothetical protein
MYWLWLLRRLEEVGFTRPFFFREETFVSNDIAIYRSPLLGKESRTEVTARVARQLSYSEAQMRAEKIARLRAIRIAQDTAEETTSRT